LATKATEELFSNSGSKRNDAGNEICNLAIAARNGEFILYYQSSL